MTIKLTQRDVAERILAILVHELKLKPGEPMPDQELKTRYRAGGGDAADIKAGLMYADDQGWMTYDRPKHDWKLTELGHEIA